MAAHGFVVVVAVFVVVVVVVVVVALFSAFPSSFLCCWLSIVQIEIVLAWLVCC